MACIRSREADFGLTLPGFFVRVWAQRNNVFALSRTRSMPRGVLFRAMVFDPYMPSSFSPPGWPCRPAPRRRKSAVQKECSEKVPGREGRQHAERLRPTTNTTSNAPPRRRRKKRPRRDADGRHAGSDRRRARRPPPPSRDAGARRRRPDGGPRPRRAQATGSRLSHRRISPSFASLKARQGADADVPRPVPSANKATNGNGGLKWIQKGGGYYSECNKRLKG